MATGKIKQFSWPAIGNDQAVEFLNRSLLSAKIAQTYIFVGPDDLGKSTIALAFARNLQGDCEGFNSDLHILEPLPDKKNISIEQVREFIKMLNLSSFLNSYKIGLIKGADSLTVEAQNALLKTLEEPKEKVIIILLLSEEESLPKTILSRAQVLYFYPVAAPIIYDYLVKNYGANRSLAKDLANLSLGRPLKALHFLENPEVYKDYLKNAVGWLSFWNLDLNGRLSALDKLFSDKTYSRAASERALDNLLLAEGLLRDLLLLSLGQKERLQHSSLMPELEKTLAILDERTGQLSGPTILEKMKLIAQAKEYLRGNVNPRLILEQLVINL
ncbi:MAG: AAA family ATPase [Patescibacteria group bacterium]|jgi:DNA polymerase-3 subunit delta'